MLCPCQVQQSLLFWAKPCLIELFEGPHREDSEKSASQSYNAFGLKATPELKTIFSIIRIYIKSHIRGYFITTHNPVDL